MVKALDALITTIGERDHAGLLRRIDHEELDENAELSLLLLRHLDVRSGERVVCVTFLAALAVDIESGMGSCEPIPLAGLSAGRASSPPP